MDEVSCRAFTFFQEAERSGWISLKELLEGSRLQLSQLAEPSQRVDWADWIYLCDRFADLVGYHRLQESAKFAMQPGFSGEVIKKVAPLVTSTLQLYKTGFEWGGASLYRCVSFEVTETGQGIRVSAALRPGYQPSRAWFEMLAGGIRLLPTFLGMPAAVIQANISSTSMVAHVTTEQRDSMWLRGKRLLTAFIAPQNLFQELTFQQKQLLETYHELSRREQSAFEMLSGLPAAIVLFNKRGIVYANASFAAAVGLPVSSILDRELASLVVAEHQEKLKQLISEEHSAQPTQLIFQNKAGDRLLLASPLNEVIFEGQRVRGIFAIDVTEETLAAMSSTTPDLIARFNKDGTLLDIFGSEERLRASTVAALRGLSLRLATNVFPEFTAEHAASLIDCIQKTLAEQKTQIIEIALQRVPLVYECIITPIQNRQEVLAIARDITQRRQQERALAVSERMASLGTLVAGLGHEINNPLTYILGNQHALLEGIERQLSGEKVDLLAMRELVQEASHGAERVRELVKGLRSFSRVEARTSGATQLNLSIQEALRMVQSQAKHQTKIEAALTEPAWVRGDRTQLVQVFVNLFVNALQSLDEKKENTITVHTKRIGDKLIASVEDSGQGILAHNLSRIFDPFFTTKPTGQGTGLGLSIVSWRSSEAASAQRAHRAREPR